MGGANQAGRLVGTGFMRFLSLGIMQKRIYSWGLGAATRGRPESTIYFAAPVIWSNTPPSAKWVFWAFCQPPNAWSMV